MRDKRKLTQLTIEGYLSDIKFYIKFLAENNKQDEKPDAIIESYKNYLLFTKKYAVATINRQMNARKVYYKSKNVFIDTKLNLKYQQKSYSQDLLSDEEIENLLNIILEKEDHLLYALVKTLKLTGMRISEALQFKTCDIDKEHITVKGKGNKYREVLLCDNLLPIFLTFIKTKRFETEYLFTKPNSDIIIDRRDVNRKLKLYGKKINIPKNKLHCHVFRHKFAKDLVDNKITIDTLADMMGHSNLNTTRIYTKKSKGELRNILNRM